MLDKIHILFVDDEPRILDGLRRTLRSMRGQWGMAFANGGAEALELLADGRWDVIISDIRMPGMSGVGLLQEVRRRHPHMIRIALSGQASRNTVLDSIGPTHQYLSKPFDAEALKAAIGRLDMLRRLLAVEKLRSMISAMESLPALPPLLMELTEELNSPEATIASVAQIIAKDVSMSGKMVQLVGSGFFGPPRHVSDPVQAVTALGIDIVKLLVLSLHVFSQFNPISAADISTDNSYRHSPAVATASKRIAAAEGADTETVDSAFLAGLLHDVGKVVLADQLAEDYHSMLGRIAAEGVDPLQAERETFQATHAEVGAYLLGIWGLPNAVVEAVAWHHTPSRSQTPDQFTALTAVHVADTLIRAPSALETTAVDQEYLIALGLRHRLPEWTNICRNTACKETANV